MGKDDRSPGKLQSLGTAEFFLEFITPYISTSPNNIEAKLVVSDNNSESLSLSDRSNDFK